MNIPLVSMVGATNELPDDDELLALSDRFLLRYEVGALKEEFHFLRLLALDDRPLGARVPLGELERVQAQARAVTVGEPIDLKKFLEENAALDDRRDRLLHVHRTGTRIVGDRRDDRYRDVRQQVDRQLIHTDPAKDQDREPDQEGRDRVLKRESR